MHGLELRDPGGAWVPASLTPGPTASETVALVDLAGPSCALADPELVDTVQATAPPGPFHAVRFRLGVPEDQNHLDLAELEPPLDQPGMWWSWLYGFVFLRVDLRLEDGRGWGVHVGATGCEGDPDAGFSCTNGNRATIEVEGFDPDADVLDLDLQALLGETT